MSYLWTYIVMALCTAMTFCRVMDFPGNKDDLHDDLLHGVKNEEGLTPPPYNDSNIDSHGYRGNSNDLKNKEKLEGPHEQVEIMNEIMSQILKENNFLKDFQIVPFAREDFLKLENVDFQKQSMLYQGIPEIPVEEKDFSAS